MLIFRYICVYRLLFWEMSLWYFGQLIIDLFLMQWDFLIMLVCLRVFSSSGSCLGWWELLVFILIRVLQLWLRFQWNLVRYVVFRFFLFLWCIMWMWLLVDVMWLVIFLVLFGELLLVIRMLMFGLVWWVCVMMVLIFLILLQVGMMIRILLSWILVLVVDIFF